MPEYKEKICVSFIGDFKLREENWNGCAGFCLHPSMNFFRLQQQRVDKDHGRLRIQPSAGLMSKKAGGYALR
jgi:hypothetical protein